MAVAAALALAVVAVAVFALWLVAALGEAPTWWTLTAVSTSILVMLIADATIPIVVASAPTGAVLGLALRMMRDLSRAIETMCDEP